LTFDLLKETNWEARSAEIKGIENEIVLSHILLTITFAIIGTRGISLITL